MIGALTNCCIIVRSNSTAAFTPSTSFVQLPLARHVGDPKLDRQTISNCYLSVALVNTPKNIVTRFVCQEFVCFEVANRTFEFINDPCLDSAISECNIAPLTACVRLGLADTRPARKLRIVK